MFASIDDLRREGFAGLCPIHLLRATRLRDVPPLPGVYVVLRTSAAPPVFIVPSPAGRRNGRDPSLPLAELQRRWNPTTPTVYIGKAGGPLNQSTLRGRLTAYLAHGAGRAAGHWGGRAIWQLADASELLIAWKIVTEEDPRIVERTLIAAFLTQVGQRPFANRAG